MPLSGTIHPANTGNVSLTQAGSTTDLTGVVNHPNPDPTTQTGAAIPDVPSAGSENGLST